MSRLNALATKYARTVAGIMSGTSADGIDVAIARLSGSGSEIEIELLGHTHVDYSPDFRDVVLMHALDKGTSMKSTSQLNVALAHVYQNAVERALSAVGLEKSQLDLVGCHGQTVQHVPDPELIGGLEVSSTLQLGDHAVLANLLGVPVVGNFRLPDMALGGQGAPLVPYFDYVAFSDASSYRVLLNLGGIANLTFLRPGGGTSDVIAFDTGPANMLIDFLCGLLFDEPMDRDGLFAAAAPPDEQIVDQVLRHEYFLRRPPKTTGRELFDDAFAESFCRLFEPVHGDRRGWDQTVRCKTIASATLLTARSVAQAIRRWNPVERSPDLVIASGGGTLNPTLMRMFREELQPIGILPIDDFGIPSDAKEALCFAVLAHEFVNERPTAMPSVTGARVAALLGSLSLPSEPLEG